MDFLTMLFKLLSNNKDLPYYQAERRIDLFLNIYLTEIMNYSLGQTDIKFLVPEFPLKKHESALSTKVDYLCYSELSKTIYFVELKTDANSFKASQFEIYFEHLDWKTCKRNLELINKRTNKNYARKFSKLKENLSILASNDYKIEVVYLGPHLKYVQKARLKGKVSFIEFENLRNFVPKIFKKEWVLFYEEVLAKIV